jgi:uncharacterized protein YunC (DUF1805 family)
MHRYKFKQMHFVLKKLQKIPICIYKTNWNVQMCKYADVQMRNMQMYN